MPVDLSNATVDEFQEQGTAPRAEFVALGDQAPDITKHDPNTFAALTGQTALKTLYAQGLQPTADDIKGIYNKALDSANEYHKTVAQQQEQANLELQKRAAAVTSGTLSAEEKAKAIVEIQKQQAQKQWEQGPGAVAAAASQPGGVAAGQIAKMSDEQSNKMAAYLEGTHNLQNLYTLFNQMATNTIGAGGTIKSGFGLATPLTNITSPEARTYHAYVESSLIPLAKGLMGDAATTAGRPDVSAKMEEALPTNVDNLQSGGQKIFMMLDRNIDNLKTERDIMRKKGVDTSPIDSQILDAQHYYESPEVQKYNPLNNQPVVQAGTSDQANATVANLNAGANAGVQVQPTPVPGNQSASTLNSQPLPAQQPVAAQPQSQPAAPSDLWGFGTYNQ